MQRTVNLFREMFSRCRWLPFGRQVPFQTKCPIVVFFFWNLINRIFRFGSFSVLCGKRIGHYAGNFRWKYGYDSRYSDAGSRHRKHCNAE